MCSPLPRRLLFATVFCIICVHTPGSGQDPILLQDTSVTYRLDNAVEVFIDSSDEITIDKIVLPDLQGRFFESKTNLTFGYLKSTIWLKVKTRTASPKTQWYLEIPAPFLEYVDFYQMHKGKWQHAVAGYYMPHNRRGLSHTGHVVPLYFDADSLNTLYVRIAGQSPKTFPLFAIEKEKFNQKVRFEDLGYGMFFGILIVMFFFNFFIYVTLNHTNYLLYICTIICTFLIFSSASGYAGKFLWPETPVMNFYAGRLTLGILTIFLAIFTIRFLEVKRYSKPMYYALIALIPLAVLAIILVATGIVSSAGNSLISVSTVIYMTTGIVCRINGNKTATFFIAAWTCYLIGGLLLTLRNSGVLDFNFWTTHVVEIGAALETIIIAFALGDRYRRYKLEKEQAQALALAIQQDATDKLEIKVKVRTEELSRAYEELHQTLETNKLQSKVIEDKNAELDSFFHRVSHDLKGPISSLLGLSSLAKKDIKDPQAQVYLERQHAQVVRVNNIITGLIKLARLNNADLHRQKINFEKIVDECITSLTNLPNFDKIRFKKHFQEGLTFYCEWTLLNAIFQNLIENAIKYSGDTAPCVNISVTGDTESILICVRDNGQGIPVESQARIFEMFFRATRNADGSGLGLYILKRSVDRLNGTIEVESEPGAGSTFTVRLPVEKPKV